MKTVTLEWLEEQGACEKQRLIFEQEWGASVELSLASLKRAVELELDLDWLAEYLLSASALAAYNEATASATADYDEAIAPGRKAYNEAIASAREAYKEATASAREAYNEATVSALWGAIKS